MKHSSHSSERGSVLLVAILFCALIAISLTSYVALNTQSLKMANRSFYLSAAMNMAESGLEEAMWSYNQAYAGDTTAWDGWNTSDGLTARRTYTDFSLGGNATGTVKIYVERFNPPASMQPKVIARATVTLPGGQAVITKMVEAKMRRRSYFAAGLVARNNITFSGNTASVDSWISNPDNDPTTPAVPYSTTIRRDRGSIGGASITSTLAIGNADIWGTAAVGGSSASAIVVGSNGIVGPFGTSTGTRAASNIATDFSANMETVASPTTGTTLGSLGGSIGTAGTTTIWRVPSLTETLMVYGHVTLILTVSSGVSAVDITGSESITIAAGGSLKIYTEGNVKIAGNGLLNNNNSPDTFQLWGTSTSPSPQDIKISGNGALKGLIYAPNGTIEIAGNGDVMGAAVGRDINLSGNAAFHYDESLAGFGDNSPFGIYKWRELITPADRTPYDAVLAF